MQIIVHPSKWKVSIILRKAMLSLMEKNLYRRSWDENFTGYSLSGNLFDLQIISGRQYWSH